MTYNRIDALNHVQVSPWYDCFRPVHLLRSPLTNQASFEHIVAWMLPRGRLPAYPVNLGQQGVVRQNASISGALRITTESSFRMSSETLLYPVFVVAFIVLPLPGPHSRGWPEPMVIEAESQRYLGLDELVNIGIGTGEYKGQPGYWITAYRPLTTRMIENMKLDSQRWQQNFIHMQTRYLFQEGYIGLREEFTGMQDTAIWIP
ncbi:uncharacterized protein BDR25DRAFT_363029 [Lindgomyces ingoldianus]|uniref:Uncharacterized protein n=1 Tax=Lindgomyces ingoldianus TaxID=673940 RepID=A0ACB6Q8T9_9PLEO|nr:uncharacterized protein BDR25DRAFT_363029 [Lindgomyces ingoldianus]KAF2463305.1 hypothetical protein BDR25DRAFT_363029 [Lindgomyces ingoldianus]